MGVRTWPKTLILIPSLSQGYPACGATLPPTPSAPPPPTFDTHTHTPQKNPTMLANCVFFNVQIYSILFYMVVLKGF